MRQLMQAAETINVWPSADMTKAQVDDFMKKAPFIRNFGKIESSPTGYFCNVNCVNSNKLSDNGYPVNTQSVPVFNPYKRLSAEGACTFRFELGFTDKLESVLQHSHQDEPVHIPDILTHYMSVLLDVQDLAGSVTNTGNISTDTEYWTTIPLGDLGALMARNYCRATAKIKDAPGDAFVTGGEACITLAFAGDSKILLPANAEKLDEFIIDGALIQLYGYKWNFGETSFKIWLFTVPTVELLLSPNISIELQNKQSNLFRLNSEKETMRFLLNGFDPDNPTPEVKNYIKKTPIKIFRKERFASQQDAVRNFALQSDETKMQFTIDDLKKVLDSYGLDNLKNLEQNMKTAPKKKSILFITSNPTDSNPIDFGEHFKAIDEAWQRGTDRDYFTLLNIKTGVERDKVMEILYTNEPDYIHITLHNSEIKGLYFQDAAKNPDPMTAAEFAEYIKTLCDEKKPEAVILCACNSLEHATAVRQYCNHAVGTNYVFPDEAAILYANKFYSALFNGKNVNFCHKVAVQGIQFAKPPFSIKGGPEVYTILELL